LKGSRPVAREVQLLACRKDHWGRGRAWKYNESAKKGTFPTIALNLRHNLATGGKQKCFVPKKSKEFKKKRGRKSRGASVKNEV